MITPLGVGDAGSTWQVLSGTHFWELATCISVSSCARAGTCGVSEIQEVGRYELDEFRTIFSALRGPLLHPRLCGPGAMLTLS